MAGDTDNEFDPRFDRAFQRGFEGEVTTRPPQPTGYLPTNPVRQAQASAYAPGYAPTQPEVVVPRPGAVAAEPLGTAAPLTVIPGLAAPDGSTIGAVDVPVDEAPRRNPFLIGLTIISVVLVVGGVAGLQWLRGRFLAPDIATELDFVTVQAATTGLVIVIGLGLATAIGVLFVHAARWGKRRA